MNGIRTEKIGAWAYIEMNKADAKSASPEEYAEFAKNVVNGSGYNWFSVIFEEQTGINYTGCYIYLATYGKLDDEGCITEPIGDISLDTKTGQSAYKLREAPPTPEPAETEPTEAPASTDEVSSDTGPQSLSAAGGSNNFNIYSNPDQQNTDANYILNTSSMKVHYPDCSAVEKIAPENNQEFYGTLEEALEHDYSRCGICFK